MIAAPRAEGALQTIAIYIGIYLLWRHQKTKREHIEELLAELHNVFPDEDESEGGRELGHPPATGVPTPPTRPPSDYYDVEARNIDKFMDYINYNDSDPYHSKWA